MNGFRLGGALALAAALCAAPGARAQGEWEESGAEQPGTAGGGLGPRAGGVYAAVGGFLAAPNTEGFGRVEGAGGFSARAGFRGGTRFAGELVLDWVEGFDRPGGSELETFFLGANAKGFFPLRYVQPYLQGGIGYFHVGLGHQDFDDGAMRMGFGAEVPISRHFGVDLEAVYLWAWEDTDGADYAQFGASVQYWF